MEEDATLLEAEAEYKAKVEAEKKAAKRAEIERKKEEKRLFNS